MFDIKRKICVTAEKTALTALECLIYCLINKNANILTSQQM